MIKSLIFMLFFVGLFSFLMINSEIENKRIVDKNVTVDARVVKVWKKTTSHKTGKHSRTTTTHYHVALTYNYNGKNYTYSDMDMGTSRVSVNQNVRVFIDPDNPQKIVLGRTVGVGFVGIILLIIFAVVAFSIVFTIIKYKKNPLPKSMPAALNAPANNNGNNYSGNSYNNNYSGSSYGNNNASYQNNMSGGSMSDTSGFGGNFVNNPNASYNNSSAPMDTWTNPPASGTNNTPARRDPSYSNNRSGFYDPNASYNSPYNNPASSADPFVSGQQNSDDEWSFLNK